jgi:hypothetical protein
VIPERALFVSALLLFLPLQAAAETGTLVHIDLLVPPVQKLEMVNPILVMPTLTATDLSRNFIDLPERIGMQVSSNTPWELSVRLTETSSARSESLPSLLCAARGESPRPLDRDWQLVARGDPGAKIEVSLGLRVPLDLSGFIPGTHEVTLDYRLTSAGY